MFVRMLCYLIVSVPSYDLKTFSTISLNVFDNAASQRTFSMNVNINLGNHENDRWNDL